MRLQLARFSVRITTLLFMEQKMKNKTWRALYKTQLNFNLLKKINNKVFFDVVAQSAGAIEYTACFSAEGKV